MTPARVVVAAVLLLGSVLLQVTVLTRLGLPGATPDLVLVLVLAYGFVRGAVVGAAMGFAAGMLLDLAPPAVGYVGLTALLMAAAGYVAGVVSERTGGVVAMALATVAGLCVAVVLGRAVIAGLLGDPRILWHEVPLLAVTEAVYGVLLAALIIPALGSVDRYLEPRMKF